MSEPYALYVEKALTQLLRDRLTFAAGAKVDCEGRVFRGRQRYGARDPVPMISLLQAPEVEVDLQPAGDGSARTASVLYLLQGWADDDHDNPTDPAHELLAEVKRVLGGVVDEDSEDFLLKSAHPDNEPLIEGLDVSFGLVRPPEQTISDKAYFWLPLRIGFVESLAAPYDLP